MNTDKYVGLDVHKDTTVVAIAEGGREGECRIYGTISSDLHALEKLLRKLGGAGENPTGSPPGSALPDGKEQRATMPSGESSISASRDNSREHPDDEQYER